jgi:hypothetical protein
MAPGSPIAGPVPATTTPAHLAQLESRLARFGAAADRLLASWPRDDAAQARARLERELGFGASDDGLRALARLAADPVRSGPAYAWPRRLLALRAAGAAELRVVWSAARPDAHELRGAQAALRDLVSAGRALDRELDTTLAAADRELLRDIRSSFALPECELHAASLLAERVSLLAELAVSVEALQRHVPALARDEAELIHRALDDAAPTAWARACVDALALRTILGEAFEALRDQARREGAVPAAHAPARERLTLAADVYHTVAARLQRQEMDAALNASGEVVEAARGVGRTLYDLYRKILPLVGPAPQCAEDEIEPRCPPLGSPALPALLRTFVWGLMLALAGMALAIGTAAGAQRLGLFALHPAGPAPAAAATSR